MKQHLKILTGINIQWPWSELLVNGDKIIETRRYRLPDRLRVVELAVIETPGSCGRRDAGILKARIIGTIVFGEAYQYKNRTHWLRDFPKHRVPRDDSQFTFKDGDVKWGWVVLSVRKLDVPVKTPSKRGIIFAKNCEVPAE